MIKVAHATPSFARVVVGTEIIAILRGPLLGGAVIIIGTDVCGEHLVGLAIPGLRGEVDPVADVLPVVDNHVSDSAETEILKGRDHRTQLGFVAERAIIIVKPPQVIIAHRGAATVTTLWNPDEIEAGGEVGGLLLKSRPLRVVV